MRRTQVLVSVFNYDALIERGSVCLVFDLEEIWNDSRVAYGDGTSETMVGREFI